MQLKTKFFKISINKYRILIWGRLSKYKYYEIQIEPGGMTSGGISISACIFKRLFADLVLCCEIDMGKLLWGCFVIKDTRIWDEHADKPVTWEEYENYPKNARGNLNINLADKGKKNGIFPLNF